MSLLSVPAFGTLLSFIKEQLYYVIGMNESIVDTASINFAARFYDALGAHKNYKFAYDIGCNVLKHVGFSQEQLPIFRERKDSMRLSIDRIYEHQERERQQLEQEEKERQIARFAHTYAVKCCR